ncbi:MAG: hypothetical protein KDG52_12150 [Rhodocyclaceae bacterium]|nr:hypothetical protein [Rhodocyclaceae bacterium]
MCRLYRFCLVITFCLHPAIVRAEISSEAATELMNVSGMTRLLQSLPKQMQAGFLEGLSAGTSELEPQQRARIEAAVVGAYSPARMRYSVRDRLRRGLDATRVGDLMHWYRGEIGASITRLEIATLADDRSSKHILADNAERLAGMPATRRGLLERAVAASRAVRMAENLVINMIAGLEYGSRRARGEGPDSPSLAELRQQLEINRPALAEAFLELSLAISAETYQSLAEDELAAYVGFLESPAGSHFHELGVAALDAALLDAACRLGELLPLGPEQSI